MLAGGADPVEAVDVPPEGFVRLTPAPRPAEVPAMFGRLGTWAGLTRRGLAVGRRCSCERLPVWIRVIPSVPWDRRAPPWGLWIYGVGGILIPFPGIKLVDMILVALGLV